ncbi:MAG: histidine phosphatase family protein [Chromatiales bacterium]|jgi:phosphohistidine phosphatase|nr:histidine phosphatase family protein [Chromatiales bacterium]
MTRALLVLRHGEAAGERGGSGDFNRPLTREGASDAARVGCEMKARGWIPDHVLYSSAQRTQETVVAVLAELGIALTNARVRSEKMLYNAPLDVLLHFVSGCPSHVHRVLIVGHNPGLEQLVEYLADAPPLRKSNGKLMTTAALACLQTQANWRELGRGGAHLEALLRD